MAFEKCGGTDEQNCSRVVSRPIRSTSYRRVGTKLVTFLRLRNLRRLRLLARRPDGERPLYVARCPGHCKTPAATLMPSSRYVATHCQG